MTREKAMRIAFSLSSSALNQATNPRQAARARGGRACDSMAINIGSFGGSAGDLRACILLADMRIISIDIAAPNVSAINEAAEILRRGELVAFPTETVYGLGANALDALAVARIFAAKGRPSYNPLIVHVPSDGAARELVSEWPEEASRLARAFWPGPL